MTAAASQREPPQVPNHELLRVIGRGAYGEIWLARSELGGLRAVKVVHRQTFESETAFQREFEGMARFEPISREHAGFVDILHVGRDAGGGFFYYVMELADDHIHGQTIDPAHYVPKTLRTELARRSRLLAEEVVMLGLSLAEALAALHREGLVHRDIKPANIIFVGGRPKIADIGLVAKSGRDSFVGTEGYVPPEGPGTAQGDLFSLGKVLYELAMGKDRLDFPALNTRFDELPDKAQLIRLNEVLLRACASEPTQRYARAEQLHADLACLRDGRPLLRLGRRRWPWVLLVLLLASAAAGAVYWRAKTARGGVTIETDPPGAMVVIGDRMVRSPATFDRLPIGPQTARIMLPGYEPVLREVQIEADAAPVLPRLILERSRGALALRSESVGAAFTLREGERVVESGTLPADLANLPTGTYELRAVLAGRERVLPIEVRRGETALHTVQFASGRLRVTSEPGGVEVFVDGEASGRTPLDLVLPDGPHELRARYPRWPEQIRAIQVAADQPLEEKFEFAPGRVKISSAPNGAGVFREGREVGTTPLLLDQLAPGPVHFELRLAGYQTLKLAAEVKPGEQTFLGGRLTKQPGPLRGQPWENTLGMKFVPVGEVLFAVWPTRVRDYDIYRAASGRARQAPDFPQDENHPVVLVNLEDANAFCEWLTSAELAAEKLAEGQHYRLPRDLEWSFAAGLINEGRTTPEERDGRVREFAWGRHWPPPAGMGNFAETVRRDGFAQTSPVGSFPANARGLHDLSGNVWEWIAEPYNPASRWGVLRGGSWATAKEAELSLSYRNVVDPAGREVIYGFRVVLVPGAE
jgi:hypothetical protein